MLTAEGVGGGGTPTVEVATTADTDPACSKLKDHNASKTKKKETTKNKLHQLGAHS
jgi:hypothetical protein